MKKSQVVVSAPHIEVIATLLPDAIKNREDYIFYLIVKL
jgi:hypothetical protein